jgi:hypothetical protein
MSLPKIEGIYNYCDRWCERCTFTSRCAIFEKDKKHPDQKTRAFQERLGENILKANAILRKAAQDAGLNMEAAQARIDESVRRNEQIEIEVRQHPMMTLSAQYIVTGREWLKRQPGMLEHLEDLKTQLTIGMETNEGAKRETRVIKESLAAIQWYLDFIHDRLSRALEGKLMSLEGQGMNADGPRDHDGSAKIAIIAIDRSIEAWSELFTILPEEEDHFLKVLSMLERIKKSAIGEFPLATSFMRPGFD